MKFTVSDSKHVRYGAVESVIYNGYEVVTAGTGRETKTMVGVLTESEIKNGYADESGGNLPYPTCRRCL
jgi:hypothetical protein